MRFGVMTLQQGLLIPPDLSPEGAMRYMARLDHAEIVRRVAAQGFDTVELSGDMVLFFPQAFSPETVARLAALRGEKGLTYTVHLPLWSVETSTPLTPVREGSVQAVVEVIQATRRLEPAVYVLHATGALAAEFYRMELPSAARALILRLFQQQAGRSIGAILAQADLPSRRLAVETIEFPLELTLELADRLDLSVCFDTGHILAGFSGAVDFPAALELCLPRLAEVHLHDCPRQPPGKIGYGQDHRPLGMGDLDVGGLLDRLEEAGYSGPVILELRVEEALASLSMIQALRPGLLRGGLSSG